MEIRMDILLIILGCGLVTWLPRILPFIFSKKIQFPKWLEEYLSYIPICILTALFVQGLFSKNAGGLPTLNVPVFLASLPTFLVGIRTKNLMWTVIVGMISMALLRFLM